MNCTCQEAATNAYSQLRDKGVLHEDALKAAKNVIRLRHGDFSPAEIDALAVEWTSEASS